jgi:endonuclease/exonuclease/phosphatase family metal-dependent hydrolase
MNKAINGGFTTGSRQPWSRDSIRVVSWNVERGLQFSAILDFLGSAEADLILLQEVDRNARRTRHLDVARELARPLGLNYVFGTEFQELSEGSERWPAHHGLATLSPWPLSKGRIIRFQHQSSFWEPRWYVPQISFFQRRIGGRIALVSEALIDRQRLTSYNVHLESRGRDVLRLQQLQEVLDDNEQHTESPLVIIGGDFNLNAGKGGAAAMLHRAGFHDAVRLPDIGTTTARVPFRHSRPIDWIYIAGAVQSEGLIHEHIRASDHYPLSATFAVRDRAEIRNRLLTRRPASGSC